MSRDEVRLILGRPRKTSEVKVKARQGLHFRRGNAFVLYFDKSDLSSALSYLHMTDDEEQMNRLVQALIA